MKPALLVGIFCALVASVGCEQVKPVALAGYLRGQSANVGSELALKHRHDLAKEIEGLSKDTEARKNDLKKIMGVDEVKALESYYRYDFLGRTEDEQAYFGDRSEWQLHIKIMKQGKRKAEKLEAILLRVHELLPYLAYGRGDLRDKVPADVAEELNDAETKMALKSHYDAFTKYLAKDDDETRSFKNLRKATEAALGCLHVDRKAAAFLTKLSELIEVHLENPKEQIIYQALYHGQNTVSSRSYLFVFSSFWIATCSLLILFKEVQLRKQKVVAVV